MGSVKRKFQTRQGHMIWQFADCDAPKFCVPTWHAARTFCSCCTRKGRIALGKICHITRKLKALYIGMIQ